MDNELLEHEEYLEYQDPNFDYKILDDNESYLENIFEILSTPKTTTDECVTDNEYDKQNKERDINWSTLDNNLQSEVESMWTLPTDNSNILDYKIDIAIKAGTKNAINNLSICTSHYTFDQNKLHLSRAKQDVLIEKSWIHRRKWRNICIQNTNEGFHAFLSVLTMEKGVTNKMLK
ncbi:4520_t:CDS:2, partial [Gigaspora rosea]